MVAGVTVDVGVSVGLGVGFAVIFVVVATAWWRRGFGEDGTAAGPGVRDVVTSAVAEDAEDVGVAVVATAGTSTVPGASRAAISGVHGSTPGVVACCDVEPSGSPRSRSPAA